MIRVYFQSSLMLSAEERQELAENAMEQLATGLNKAAETMQTGEEHGGGEGGEEAGQAAGQPVPDVASLQDTELYQLLEEAYTYKRPKDRQGKSEMFRVSSQLSILFTGVTEMSKQL